MDESYEVCEHSVDWENIPIGFRAIVDDMEIIQLYNGGFLVRQQAFARPVTVKPVKRSNVELAHLCACNE